MLLLCLAILLAVLKFFLVLSPECGWQCDHVYQAVALGADRLRVLLNGISKLEALGLAIIK